MRILFIGTFNTRSDNIAQARAFVKLGHEVVEFDHARIGFDLKSYSARDQKIIQLLNESPFDLAIIDRGTTIAKEVIESAKAFVKVVVIYTGSGDAEFDDELISRLNMADIGVLSQPGPYELLADSNDNIHYIIEGYDPELDHAMKINRTRDTLFIGTLKTQERIAFTRHLSIETIGNAKPHEHAKLISSARININFSEGQLSNRVYKILATEGFLLTQRWSGMELTFEPGKDFVVFDDLTDLTQKIDYYLINRKEREKIAKSGHIKVTNYTRSAWAQEIIDLAKL